MSKAVKREYVSPARAEQARLTRRKILAAAERLFRARGIAATPIVEIARAAGVSAETIYLAFGSKRELLAQMVAAAIAEGDEQTPVLERAWVATMRRAPERVKRLHFWISHTCDTLERTSAIHALIREAAVSEPTLAKLRKAQQQFRLDMQTALMRLVAEQDRKAPRLDAKKSGEAFWILASPELHQLLRVDRGWSKARYQAWLTDTLELLLLKRRAGR
jgi:AcrR family transcriptional regulator